jgi:hypothetical protein
MLNGFRAVAQYRVLQRFIVIEQTAEVGRGVERRAIYELLTAVT